MGDKGKVAIVSAQPTAANQNAWIAAFRDEIKKYPGIEIVDEVYGYDNEQKAFDATVALTTKYPDLAGIYAPTCPGLPAVARALDRSTRARAGQARRHCACRASPPSTCSMARSRFFYLWDPIKLGYVTYYAAKYFAEGKIKGKPGDCFTIDEGQVAGHLYDRADHDEIVTGEPLAIHRGELQGSQLLETAGVPEERRRLRCRALPSRSTGCAVSRRRRASS